VWVWPAAIDTTFDNPVTATGLALMNVEPFPSCPLSFFPQQRTAPVLLKTAQE
jgi:hypothetical protein